MAVRRGKRVRSKYGNVRSAACLSCGGEAVAQGACLFCKGTSIHVFDSRAELKRYGELCLFRRLGELDQLCVQPRYPIHVEGEHVGDYVADFSYRDLRAGGGTVVEDVKGGDATDTQLSRFKRKCVAAQYGITVTVVRR